MPCDTTRSASTKKCRNAATRTILARLAAVAAVEGIDAAGIGCPGGFQFRRWSNTASTRRVTSALSCIVRTAICTSGAPGSTGPPPLPPRGMPPVSTARNATKRAASLNVAVLGVARACDRSCVAAMASHMSSSSAACTDGISHSGCSGAPLACCDPTSLDAPVACRDVLSPDCVACVVDAALRFATPPAPVAAADDDWRPFVDAASSWLSSSSTASATRCSGGPAGAMPAAGAPPQSRSSAAWAIAGSRVVEVPEADGTQ
mmetsp:Transcript_53658/g.165030  ORF Transcript_53658/g.165030 Transcript_53658/m.165030 type:complete len:261 (+) Transcript_53658:1406-2188(+)